MDFLSLEAGQRDCGPVCLSLDNPALLRAFRDWLVEESQNAMPAVSYERVAGER